MLTLTNDQKLRVNNELIGTEGTIDAVISQGKEWRVRVQGILWTGYSETPCTLNPGDRVRVLGRDKGRLKLRIEPL